MKIIKNYLIFAIFFFLIIFFFQLIFHLNFFKIVNQKNLPRNILYNLDFFFHSFYPDTFDKNLKNYTAILGDSYGWGEGDEWLNNKQMYSAIHFLHEEDKNNYINFSVPGGRSITSFREFFFRFNQIKKSKFLPVIDEPKKIIFFFYEGNDIIDNYVWFKKLNTKNKTVENFVKDEIENFSYYNKRIFNIYLPVFNVFKNFFYEKFIHYIYLPYARKIYENKKKYEESDIIKNTIIFDNYNFLTYEGYIENPGYNLNLRQLDISLEIFYESMKYFKKKFPSTSIEILYIPSHATIYEWKNNITIKYENNSYLIDKIKRDNYYNYIINSMANFSNKNNVKFINSTNNLKIKSKNIFLHGTTDKRHFSKIGYKILSDTVLEK